VEEKSRILKKADSDKSRPVSFKESFGGSESQFRLLIKHLPDESFKNINLILNSTNHDLIEKDKINVLWMHHFINQKEAKNLASKDFVNKLDWIVYNSNWNHEQHLKYFKIPKNKSVVIRNAIEKINYIEKPKDKINLIYHTTPWRGLKILLKVFKDLNLDKVELNISSSTIIYGKKFNDLMGGSFENLFNECKNTKNVNYFGFQENKKIINQLKKMHIFAYPSIWPETSCIAAIEAMAASCEVVTTNLGALNETCSPFGKIINFEKKPEDLETKFREALLESIKNFWSDETQKKLKSQREMINKTYSWDARAVEWKNFFDEVRKLKS
tara:strand:- start:4246 stop:5229 length:984 start_codon:yes stop_codon:yes gene_type:complete